MTNKSNVESYLTAKWAEKHQEMVFASIKRGISPSGRFLLHQFCYKKPVVHDLFYQQKIEVNHSSRFETKNGLSVILSPLHFIDERFILFMKMEDDRQSVIILAELQLKKKKMYDWDSIKVNWNGYCSIVVNSEDSMNHVLIMDGITHEIALILKLENTSNGPRICKSSLNFSHQIPHCLEHRMLSGQKMQRICGFPIKLSNRKVDMTQIVSYNFETKESEIIMLEGLTQLQQNYIHSDQEYYRSSAGCWMGRRFFGVFEPKSRSSSRVDGIVIQVIFCLNLDTQIWELTPFVFKHRIRQLSIANDQLVVEIDDSSDYYYLSPEAGSVRQVISCYRVPIKCPTSLQRISFEANRRYLRDKPRLAEEFEQFILPEELRKIEFN